MSLDKLTIATADITLEIGARDGVWLNRIVDLRAQREWLGSPTSLFAFKVHGQRYESNRDLVVDHASESSLRAHAREQLIAFELSFAASKRGDVVTITLVVTNQGQSPLTIGLVVPRIRGLVPPLDASGFVGCVPQEAAGVADLTPRHSHLEVTESRDGGLEVAVIRSDSRLVFSKGIAGQPWHDDVNGNVVAEAFRAIPRSAFAAVRRNLVQFDTFYADREGKLWTAWLLRLNPTADAVIDAGELSAANFAEPGASLAAIQRTETDIDLYVIGRDRKLWRFFERNNGAWSPPEEMPNPGRWLVSGAPVQAVRRAVDLVDVFFADAEGNLWVAHQSGWAPNRAPVWQLEEITRDGAGRVPVDGHIRAVAHPNGTRVDVFFVGRDGGFYSASALGDGNFSAPVLRSSSVNFARPGTKIAAAWRNDIQLDTFVVGDNAVTTLFAVNDIWRSASLSLPPDMPRFVAEGAGLSAHARAGSQLDLFVVAEDGKVWSNFVIGGGEWSGWFPIFEAFVPLGMPVNPSRDLPGAMNSLEVASVTDRRRGGGIFVADLEGDVEGDRTPIQFCLSAAELRGHWRAELNGNESVAVPRFGIGVHPSGDWRYAIDFMRRVRPPAAVSPSTPAWLREAGAIYASSGGGYGAIYLAPEFAPVDLRDRLAGLLAWPGASFRSLPFLHKQAKSLGTDVLYLADYWEPATSAPPPDYNNGERSPYWNKGDYLPRQDLGGEAAFIEGIRGVHNAGGRVILYVEPFILFDRSQVFQAVAALDLDERDGAHRFEPGFEPDTAADFLPYGPHYRCPPPFYLPWQDHIVSVCERLVGCYGADGIFLDSWAWQMNIALCIRGRRAQGVGFEYFSMAQWNRGVLALTRRVRAAIRHINPEAVVLGETTSGPMVRAWDGGFSTDFTYSQRDANRERMAASPMRYYAPRANWFTNGTTINELYQVFAAGHSLALAGGDSAHRVEFVSSHRDIIRRLVVLRRELKDALIYGRLIDLPDMGSAQAIAYLYSGRSTLVLTIVNVTDEDYYGAARSETFARHPEWTDALDPTKPPVKANPDLLIYIPAKGIRVFRSSRDLLPIIQATETDKLEALPFSGTHP